MTFQTLLALAALSLSSAVFSADETVERQTQAERNARADGASIAQAAFCELPKEKIRSYVSRLKTATLESSNARQISLNEADYDELRMAGFQETKILLDMVNLHSAPKTKKNRLCKNIADQVKTTLSDKL